MNKDEYCACSWTSLSEFRYMRNESVYVTLMTVYMCFIILIQSICKKG